MPKKKDKKADNNIKILLHYLLAHKDGDYLILGKGRDPYIEVPEFDYITDWSIKEHTDKYWVTIRPNYIDFLPILEQLNQQDYIFMNRIDERTYKVYLRPSFFEIPFIKRLQNGNTINHKEEKSENLFSKQCKINEEKNIITIGGYTYSSFSDLFEQHKQIINDVKKDKEESLSAELFQEKVRTKKAKWKNGIRLIFAIIKCRENNPNCNVFDFEEVYSKYDLMNSDGRKEIEK